MVKFRQLLLQENSGQHARYIADQVVKGEFSTDEIIACLLSEEIIISQRAAWAFSMIADRDHSLMMPYFGQILNHLDNPVHDAVIRCAVRWWSKAVVPEEHEGAVFERCFNYLINTNMAPAIRIFSMTVCSNLSTRFPELACELIEVITEHLEHGTAGYKSRARRELKRLYKVKKHMESTS